MERKKKYEEPNLRIITLLDDVIRTSTLIDGGDGSGGTLTYPTDPTTIKDI